MLNSEIKPLPTLKDAMGFFNGLRLKRPADGLQTCLKIRIPPPDVTYDWIEFSNLSFLTQVLLIGPAIEAMRGPALINHGLTFANGF